jgi:hypothetical protein
VAPGARGALVAAARGLFRLRLEKRSGVPIFGVGIPSAYGVSGKRDAPIALESKAPRRVIVSRYCGERQNPCRVLEVRVADEIPLVTGSFNTELHPRGKQWTSWSVSTNRSRTTPWSSS